MDPSLSISSDTNHPPQFIPFQPFPISNPFVSGTVSAPIHSIFGGPVNLNQNNNHELQPPLQTQTLPPQASLLPHNPSLNHPPYSDMICAAVAALNEPEGSSKMAISRYIERFNPGLPPAHGALLTHHLKTLKNNGVLSMVKKSYKFGGSFPLESIAVAAAGQEDARSEILPSNTVNDQRPFDSVAIPGSASQPQKRGRGRPPKSKPEAQEQPSDVQSSDVQPNGQPKSEQNELALTIISEEATESAKRRPGRPRLDESSSIVQTSVMAGILKPRGRPPGRRAAGRQRKPKSVSSTASVFPYVTNGARRRGRSKRVDSSATVAPEGGEIVAGKKRGRGRPPKIGGVISMLMKAKRGRPVGRPRKAMLITGATGTQENSYGELKRKFDLFQEKAKEIVNVLKSGDTKDDQAVVQAIEELERLTVMESVEIMEEDKPVEEEEVAAPPETETQTEAETEREEDKEEGEVEKQTEAQAMQEALF